MFERCWRPASLQPDYFLKTRKHPLQGHGTCISQSMPLPSLSSDMRGLQTSLSLSQRQNCFSGWLTQFDNTKSTGQEKNKTTKSTKAKDRLKPLYGPSQLVSLRYFWFFIIFFPELGCFWTWVFSKHPAIVGLWAVWETDGFPFQTSPALQLLWILQGLWLFMSSVTGYWAGLF